MILLNKDGSYTQKETPSGPEAAKLREIKHLEEMRDLIGQATRQKVLEWTKENSTPSGEIPEDSLREQEIVFFVKGKRIRNESGAEYRFSVITGSPLYIALYRKRYDEAERILKENPLSAEPGFAAIPADIVYNEKDDAVKIEHRMAEALYLEELFFSDPEIPDGLFRNLCLSLSVRSDDEADLPNYYASYADPLRADALPLFIREIPYRYWLRECYPEGDTEDTNVSRSGRFMNLRRRRQGPSEEDKKRAALEDMAVFRRLMYGLVRLRCMDPGLHERFVNEESSVFLFLAYCIRMCRVIRCGGYDLMPDLLEGYFRREFGETAVSGIRDTAEEFGKMKVLFEKAGIGSITAERLWSAIEEHYAALDKPDNAYYSAWIFYDIWKSIFRKRLVFPMDQQDHWTYGSVRNRMKGLFGLRTGSNGIRSGNGRTTGLNFCEEQPKAFLEVIDGVKWGTDLQITNERREIEKLVIDRGDKEYLLLCLEKNLITAKDAEFLVSYLAESGKHPELSSLLLLKKYGRIKNDEGGER